MNYRKLLVIELQLQLQLLLLLLVSSSPLSADNSSTDHRRVKRLSSPDFDKDQTLELAKYVVSIRSRTPRLYFGDNHYCCGVIVAPKFVLTAAHCTMDKSKILHQSRTLLVVGGTPNRLKYVTGTSVSLPVSKIYVPMNFTMHNTDNIALLRLAYAWPSNHPRIAIASLPDSAPSAGSNYTVLGWGSMFKGGPMSSVILQITVRLIEHKNCSAQLRTFMDEMLCAGNLHDELDQSPCAGDTGSPMIANDTVYGVVSYRLGCGSKTMPSVYTNVHHEMEWINYILENAAVQRRAPLATLMLAVLLQIVLHF
ncbi:trypsin-like isoform X1 [Drosophila busckii]|uniref:trypsin-like isoform X1 n=1 Tax=Drosophila busckii TaxID=30019 RepID=UPI00083F358F|nr:trypsin-like isoform X1 [Drosophila busckii]